MARPPVKSGNFPRANNEITAQTVRVIDNDGEPAGVLPIKEALALAVDRGLDLVEVAPNSDPPVCKVLDFGRYKYEAQKKAHEARKKQKIVDVKEIKLRPNIGEHDYDVKLRNLLRFLRHGDKVKVTLRFRGREITHKEIGLSLLERMRNDAAEFGKAEVEPKMEGRQMMMVLAPITTK